MIQPLSSHCRATQRLLQSVTICNGFVFPSHSRATQRLLPLALVALAALLLLSACQTKKKIVEEQRTEHHSSLSASSALKASATHNETASTQAQSSSTLQAAASSSTLTDSIVERVRDLFVTDPSGRLLHREHETSRERHHTQKQGQQRANFAGNDNSTKMSNLEGKSAQSENSDKSDKSDQSDLSEKNKKEITSAPHYLSKLALVLACSCFFLFIIYKRRRS